MGHYEKHCRTEYFSEYLEENKVLRDLVFLKHQLTRDKVSDIVNICFSLKELKTIKDQSH